MIKWSPTDVDLGIDPDVDDYEAARYKAGWRKFQTIGDGDGTCIEIFKGECAGYFVQVWTEAGLLYDALISDVSEMIKLVQDSKVFVGNEKEASFIPASGWEAVYITKEGSVQATSPVVIWGVEDGDVQGYVTSSRASRYRHPTSGYPIGATIDPAGSITFGPRESEARFGYYRQTDG